MRVNGDIITCEPVANLLSRETREGSEKIGWRMLGSVLNLMEDETLAFYRTEITARRCFGYHAVVHGLVGAAQGIEPRTALLAFAFGLVANQTAASLKLMRIGQTQLRQCYIRRLMPLRLR